MADFVSLTTTSTRYVVDFDLLVGVAYISMI